ncbi:hypothetical protein BD626DRAFT_475127 [Schizophyllum amplum]|uniref:Uncharacterized protein n=1 Tax=Schizophyllum amplum TaxID=97359 RepID=A0A550CY97_9AGAR|nr:hypothetical protein BD626DRAFT_475127 [Auriculariopsis ampla]
MAYNYYRQNGQGGWGTNQYQFGPPPTPGFHPQPSWGGLDYYRAHALNPDESLYQHAYETIRAPVPGIGVGLHEARHWHRRAYGGMADPTQLTPEEIGYASAYEAYRVWIHNADIVQPVSGDPERQREAMIGLAVAEAARALQYSGRVWDTYSRNRAADVAAATASIIYEQVADNIEDEYEFGGRRPRSRRGSVASIGSAYADDYDPYQADYRARPRRRRSVSHRRSYSQGPPLTPSPMPYAGSASMTPGVGVAGSASSAGSYSPYQGQQYGGSQYAGSGSAYGGGMGSAMGGDMMGGMGTAGSMGGGAPMPMPSAGGQGYQMQMGTPSNGMPAPIIIKPQSSGYERRRATSMSVPYGGQYGGMGGSQYGGMGGQQYGGMGMGQPGMGMGMGMGQPGMGQMGMGQPGMGQPGMGQPGMGQPGMGMDPRMGGMSQGMGGMGGYGMNPLGGGLGSGGIQYGALPGGGSVMGAAPGQPIIVQMPRRHKHRHKHHHRSSSRRRSSSRSRH